MRRTRVKVAVSAGLIAGAAGVLAATSGLQAQIALCGQSGGLVCRVVKTCFVTDCVTITQHYPAGPSPTEPVTDHEEHSF